ncbi:MAG: cytidylyltransferase domain-containing protein [Tepidisphaeraceae bacterium]
MRTLGVIIARGGSQGLPDKHLLPLMGRPVIEYTFEHARQSARLTRVVLSSDCPRILALGRHRGVSTLVRPAELATDEASVQDVLLHTLNEVESSGEFLFDSVALLYGNVPVRPAGLIDQALAMLEATGCDSVRSLTPVGKWHPAWMMRLEGTRIHPLETGSIHRRQDLPTLYLHDGGIVVASRAALVRAADSPDDPHAFFGHDCRGLVAGGPVVEIDQRRDLLLAAAALGETDQSVLRMAS